MLTIVIEGLETFNEETELFDRFDDVTLDLEHSLISLSKWESKHQKAFLSTSKKTREEIFDYLKMMIVTPGIDPEVIERCSVENLNEIQDYIDSAQSATKFGEIPDKKIPGEVTTSELIYYWLIAFNIPFECQYWHLNRLFALIRVCNQKQSKPKRMSKNEVARRNYELNMKRRQELGTSG